LALGLAIGLGTRGIEHVEWPRVAAIAAAGVETFIGAARRFESWGGVGGSADGVSDAPAVAVVHDYAHHPTELAALLGATREAFPGRRLHVLFQPHQQSRTARLLDDFADTLAPTSGDTTAAFADALVVAPVYGARRHIDGAHAAGAPELAAAVRARGGAGVSADTLLGAVETFVTGLPSGVPVVALVVGAGDVEDVRLELLARLSFRFDARPVPQ